MKMLRYSLMGVIFILTTPFISAQVEKGSDPSKLMATMFRKKTEEWRLAFNTRDAKNLVQFYSEDAQYIASDAPGLVAKGRDKLITCLQKSLDGGSHMDSLEILSLNITDQLATVYCKFQITTGGQVTTGCNIMVLRKSGMKWHIFLHMVVM